MFTSFNIPYPEYDVICPQTKYELSVRSLTVAEEERMKGSFVNSQKVIELLNRCIYDTIIKKPEEINDYQKFLKNITIKDRDAILYGLYHITYEDIRNYTITCGVCRNQYSATVKASDTFNCNLYTGEKNILDKRVKVDLPASPGVSCIIKQPTLLDEQKSYKSMMSEDSDVINEILIIDKFEQDIPEHKKPIVYDDNKDILDAFLSLPAKSKKVINERYKEEFGKYEISLKMRSVCPKCGTEEKEWIIDLVSQFFKSVHSL